MSRPKKKLNGAKAKALKQAELVKAEIAKVELPPALEPGVEDKTARDIAMFKSWLLGKSYAKLGKEYKLSSEQVYNISKKYNWPELRKELRHRQFNAAIDRIRDMTVFIQDALDADIRKLVNNAIKEKRGLNSEERGHLRAMYDRTLKEIRLDEGKPTDIGTGSVQVEIVLPVGAKRFGIMPPDPKVKLVEADKVDNSTIDLNEIESDVTLKDKIK